MSGENCLGSSRNFRNYPKTRYSMDFGVGPIEHICVCVCVFVCLFVVHGQVMKIKKYIWLQAIRIIEHE
jgi:hypothetical protein